MSFEIPFEDRYWENVRERMEDSRPLEDEYKENEIDILSDAMHNISLAVDMIRDACGKIECKNCDFWDGKEDGCALKVKEWNA